MNRKKVAKIAEIILLFVLIAVFFVLVVTEFGFFPTSPSYNPLIGRWNHEQIEKIKSEQTNNFSFAVLSDSHVNPNTGANSETFKYILGDINKNNYAFAIDVGDLVVGSATPAAPFFYDIIKDEKTPFLVAVGNHDFEQDKGAYFLGTFGNFYYSFSHGNSLFIVFNDASAGVRDADQMAWLESQLKRSYQHKFVFMHIPFYDPRPGINHDLSAFPVEAKELSDLMEKYKPDDVFFGHIHANYDWTKNGVEYITTGGAGGGAVGNNPEHDFHNYIKVQVNGNKITKQVIKIP